MEFSVGRTDLAQPDRPQEIKPGGGVNQKGRARSRSDRPGSREANYPPVQSVRRALLILRVLNDARIASLGEIHRKTGLPKPTIVRMLDTLILDGYVAQDKMCEGYVVTHQVRDLGSGYDEIAEFIEVARPIAIDLTTEIKWPVGFGTFDGDAMRIQFWTGMISPWVYSNSLVGNRPNLMTSAMGRAYVAFCDDEKREEIIAGYKADPAIRFDREEEALYRYLLKKTRARGYAMRAPNTEPKRNTTIAMPVLGVDDTPIAAITISFFTSAIPATKQVSEKIIAPLRERVDRIQAILGYLHRSRSPEFGHGDQHMLLPEEDIASVS